MLWNLKAEVSGTRSLAAGLPSEEKSDVEGGAVQIDKLEEEHLQGEAVLPLRLGPWVLWRGLGGVDTGEYEHLPTIWNVRDNERGSWATLTKIRQQIGDLLVHLERR